jgi:hypothetical protein
VIHCKEVPPSLVGCIRCRPSMPAPAIDVDRGMQNSVVVYSRPATPPSLPHPFLPARPIVAGQYAASSGPQALNPSRRCDLRIAGD